MDQRALVDIVCKTGLGKMGGEIGALLGQEFACTDIQLDLTTKHQIFSSIDRQKSALTRMTVGGDREGNCFLLSSLKAAITLGSTLIMLPEDVIEEQVAEEKLDGEANDAFGEIANIVAGVLTQAFVDKYPKTLRFIKKTVEELVPTKIDPDSDSPFPPGEYYMASCKMDFEGTDLGRLEFIVPAEIFDLATAPQETAEPEPAAETSAPSHQPADQPAAKPSAEEPQPTPADSSSPPQQPADQPAAQPEAPTGPPPAPAAKKPKFADAKKLADVVFKACVGQIGEEVGALLGQTLKCDDLQLIMTSKDDFFSNHCTDKSILTSLKISGDRQGTGYLVALIPDAIVLGGTLIMLPEDVIEEEKAEGDFSGEAADAYGEIANIIAGGLTETFLERYPKQLRFVKTDSDIIVPTKVDPSSDQPFAEGSYYLASFAIHIGDFDLHRFLLIFPAEVFDLEASAETAQPESASNKPAAATPEATQKQGDQPAPGEWGGPPSTPESQPAPGEWGGAPATESAAAAAKAGSASEPAATAQPGETPASAPASAPASTTAPAAAPADQTGGESVVLLISDQKSAAEPFVEILTSASYQCRVLSFHDEIRNALQQQQVLGIFLIMSQVGEKGFAAAIKLQSSGVPMPPLIFAGSQWTRSAVLRAVKYGAKDIIVTPASGSEIQDKATQHFRKAS